MAVPEGPIQSTWPYDARCRDASAALGGHRAAALTPNIGSYVLPASTHTFASSSRPPSTSRRLNCARRKLSGEPVGEYWIAPRATESWPRGSTGAARQPSVRP